MPSKFEIYGSSHSERDPERPLECSDCKKPISVHYSEIIGTGMTHTDMCADCPVLERHLFGLKAAGEEMKTEGTTGLACGNCGMTLEALRVGAPLGCSACYDVFEEMIVRELLATAKVPQRIATAKKTQPLHIGRSQGQTQEISSSMRLLALSEELNETLKREDYEQAARLRDQINALTKDQQSTGETSDEQ